MRTRKLAPSGLLVAIVALAGCSGGPHMAEVEGTVTMGGKPLDQVQVEFWPESDGPRSVAVTDAQGRYTLKTDSGKASGAVVGMHRVLVKDLSLFGGKVLGRAGEDVDLPKGKKPRVAEHFGDAQKTPVKKEVKAGKNKIDLEVTS